MYVYMYLYTCILVYICVNCGHTCVCVSMCYVRVYARGDRGSKKRLARSAKLTHKRGRNTLDFNRFQHGDGRLGDNKGVKRSDHLSVDPDKTNSCATF